MKTNRRFLLAAIFGFALAFTFSCSGGDGDGGNSSGGSCSINGGTVKIGTQTWMAENLNCNVTGSKCYDNDQANCAEYGRLYDWATAMKLNISCNSSSCASQIKAKHQGICPSGWHIPSNDDWEELINYVESNNGCSDCAARYLKATSGWNNNGDGNFMGDGYDVHKVNLHSVRCVQDSPSRGSSSSSSLTQSSSSSKTSPSGGYSSGSTDLGVIVIENFAVTLYDIRVVIEGTVLATMEDPIVKVTYSISSPGKLSWISYDRSQLTGPIIVNEQRSFDLENARIDLRNEEIQCGITYSVKVEAWTKSGKSATRVGTFEKPDSLCGI